MVDIGVGYRPFIDDELDERKRIKQESDRQSTERQKAKFYNETEKEEITNDDLQEFDTLEAISLDRFLKLANKVLSNAEGIIKRSDTILDNVVPKESVIIPGEMITDIEDLGGPAYTKEGDDIKLSPEAIDCLVRIASYDPERAKIAREKPTADDPNVALKYLKDLTDEDNLNDHFPKFGPLDLLFFVIRIAGVIIVTKLLNPFCRIFGGTLGVFLSKLTEPIQKVVEWINGFAPGKPLGDSNRYKIDLKAEIDRVSLDATGFIDKTVRTPNMQKALGDRTPLRMKSCEKTPVPIDLVGKEVRALRRDFINCSLPGTNSTKDVGDICDPVYTPSTGQVATAQKIVKRIIKQELTDEGGNGQSTVARVALVRNLRKQAVSYDFLARDTINQLTTANDPPATDAPDLFTIDKHRAALMGFFSNLNGQLKGLDKGLSAIVELEWMTPKAKEWVCCLVRLLYVYLPWVSSKVFGGATKKKAEELQKQWHDFVSGKKDWKISSKDMILLEALDSILGWIFGSATINIDIEFPFDSDFVMSVIKETLAEVLSLVFSMIFSQLTFAWEAGMKNFCAKDSSPKLCFEDLAELCTPFKYLFNLIRCNLNNLYANLMEMLSMLWLEGNQSLRSFESTFEVLLMRRNVFLFRNIITLIGNFGSRLRQFCDVDEISTNEDVKKLLDEIDNKTSNTELSELDADTANILTSPIYPNPDSPAGPDPDAYINSQFMRKDRGAGVLDINLQSSRIYNPVTEDEQKEVDKVGKESLDPKSPVSDAAVDSKAGIDPCGERFKALIRKLVV